MESGAQASGSETEKPVPKIIYRENPIGDAVDPDPITLLKRREDAPPVVPGADQGDRMPPLNQSPGEFPDMGLQPPGDRGECGCDHADIHII